MIPDIETVGVVRAPFADGFKTGLTNIYSEYAVRIGTLALGIK